MNLKLSAKNTLSIVAAIIIVLSVILINPVNYFITSIKTSVDKGVGVSLNKPIVVEGMKGTNIIAVAVYEGEKKLELQVAGTTARKQVKAPLDANRRYRLEVTAAPKWGASKTKTFNFTTVDFLKVTGVKGDGDNIAADTAYPAFQHIAVNFDKTLSSARLLFGKKVFQGKVSSNNTVIFDTGNSIPQGTKVNLLIEAEAADGATLKGREIIALTTLKAPGVAGSDPLIGGKLAPQEKIELSFSKPMDRESMAKLLSINGNGQPLKFALSWNENGTKMKIAPDGNWPATKITLAIAAGAKAADGSRVSKNVTLFYNSSNKNVEDNTSHTAVPTALRGKGKSIIVQHLASRKAVVYAYENGKLVRQINAFGPQKGYKQLRGSFKIGYHANPLHSTMYGPYDLHYWMTISGNYGFHGHKVNRDTGLQEPYFSHGCIAMDHGEAKWLYNWAPSGTPVTLI